MLQESAVPDRRARQGLLSVLRGADKGYSELEETTVTERGASEASTHLLSDLWGTNKGYLEGAAVSENGASKDALSVLWLTDTGYPELEEATVSKFGASEG